MDKKAEFLKNIKKSKNILITGIALLVISIFLGSLFLYAKEKEMKKIMPLAEVKQENVYTYVNVSAMTNHFATNDYSGMERKTYFIRDDQYLYIADLDEKTVENLKEIYDYSYAEDGREAPKPVTIKGVTKTIPMDLKEYAIEAYNELYKEDILNSTNFSDYLGLVYLDTYESPMDNLIVDLIICLPPFLIGSFLIFIYFYKNRIIDKIILNLENKWSRILNEMESLETIHFKKAKLYLTRNFAVSYASNLEVYNYEDILWIYPHEYRYNGVLAQKCLFAVTKDSKAHKLATVNPGKKNMILFDEIYGALLKSKPKVLSGYTSENKRKAEELYTK